VIVEAITIVTLFVMVATTLIGVLDRFVFGFGLPWPEELARFLLIWSSLLAAAVAAKYQSHFRLTFLSDRLGPKWADFMDIVCVIAVLVVAWKGVEFAMIFNTQTSPALGLPMSYVYASVPVSSVLIAFYIVQNLLARHRSAGKVEG
jgi:TRAP-type C4-dicarboxylate transport system permease small subunit